MPSSCLLPPPSPGREALSSTLDNAQVVQGALRWRAAAWIDEVRIAMHDPVNRDIMAAPLRHDQE